MRSRRFLFGLVEVPMYGYYDGHTIAQIDLISADAPIVTYSRDKQKKGGRKPNRRELLESALKYKMKHRDGSDGRRTLDFSGYRIFDGDSGGLGI